MVVPFGVPLSHWEGVRGEGLNAQGPPLLFPSQREGKLYGGVMSQS